MGEFIPVMDDFSSHTQAVYNNLQQQVQQLENVRARNDSHRDALV